MTCIHRPARRLLRLFARLVSQGHSHPRPLANNALLASPRHDGCLQFRQGVRCAGPSHATSCVHNRVISFGNALVQPAMRNNSIGLNQLTMTLPLIYETSNDIRELVRLMFMSGRSDGANRQASRKLAVFLTAWRMLPWVHSSAKIMLWVLLTFRFFAHPSDHLSNRS